MLPIWEKFHVYQPGFKGGLMEHLDNDLEIHMG
jgi:hypothetical protein